MKKILVAVLCLLAFGSCNDGGGNGDTIGSLTLAWDASPELDMAGYRLYMGEKSGEYKKFFDVGKVLTYTIRNLTPGTYYFACTAYDSSGSESVYSNEVRATLNSN